MSQPLTCADAEPLLPLVADGAVDPASDPGLFAHLASCPACQRAVAEHDLITLALERGAGRAPVRRATIITWPRLAAAAGFAVAIGAAAWAMPTRASGPTAPPVAVRPPVAPAAAAAAPAAPTAPAAVATADPPAVLRVHRTDGSTIFLVRRGDAWIAVDPGQFDGSDTRTPAVNGDVPVRW